MTEFKATIFGYVEGYYGRLLSWEERASIVDELAAQGFNTYLYGPKDDAKHRLYWRESYNENWRRSFREFTQHARSKGVSVIAGIAPGLDFDFNSISVDLSETVNDDSNTLLAKARQLIDDGADALCLMMDDIDLSLIHI